MPRARFAIAWHSPGCRPAGGQHPASDIAGCGRRSAVTGEPPEVIRACAGHPSAQVAPWPISLNDRHPHAGEQPGAQGRDRQAADVRVRLRRGPVLDRRLPAHGARARVRHLRDGDHDLHLRARPRQALHRAADLPGARSSTTARSSSTRRPGIRSPKDLEGQARRRQSRLHRDDRRVGARHPRSTSTASTSSKITWVLSGDEHVAEYRPPAQRRADRERARTWPRC